MKLIFSYLKRLVLSPVLYLSILGIAFISVFGAHTTGNNGVLESFNNAMLINSFRNMTVLLAAFPFGAFYCREWLEKSSFYIISRSSVRKHLLSYIIVQGLTSFIVTFAGMFLAVIILCFTMDSFSSDPFIQTSSFYRYMNSEQGMFFLLILIYHYSISVSAWSISGLAVSAFFTNSYTAVCSPLVVSYIFELFTIGKSKYIDLWMMSISYTAVSENLFLSSAYISLVFTLLGTLFAVIFYIIAKRRVQCEIV